MRLLELFAGSRSISKVAEKYGIETYSTDISAFDGVDYVTDILNFDYNKVPFIPDVIWASPPCTTFSVASIGHHWEGGAKAYVPKTDKAILGMAISQKALEIINHYQPKLWYIENPRGLLRKMYYMQELPRHTIWYCKYGDKRAKPTDIWTNSQLWTPRPVCKNGNKNCHHEPAPRGSKTGTQGLKNNYERSKIPEQLCEDIIQASIKELQSIKTA